MHYSFDHISGVLLNYSLYIKCNTKQTEAKYYNLKIAAANVLCFTWQNNFYLEKYENSKGLSKPSSVPTQYRDNTTSKRIILSYHPS